MRSYQLLLVLLVLIILLSSCKPEKQRPKPPIDPIPPTNPLTSSKLGVAFIPMGNQQQMDFSIEQLRQLGTNRFRMNINWGRVEKDGVYDWRELDKKFQVIEENNLDVLVTLMPRGDGMECSSPMNNFDICVPASTDDFRQFMSDLLQRYPNQIHIIQFMNEFGSHWSPGTKEELVEFSNILYEEVKKNSPETIVSLGSLTRGMPNYMRVCQDDIPWVRVSDGKEYSEAEKEEYCNNQFPQDLADYTYILENAQYDILDIHLYDDVENWAEYIAKLRTFSDKEIISSEMGGPNMVVESCADCPHPYTEEYQADQFLKYVAKLEEIGLTEVYYFKMVEGGDTTPQHAKSGLFRMEDSKPVKKAVYYAFQEATSKSKS